MNKKSPFNFYCVAFVVLLTASASRVEPSRDETIQSRTFSKIETDAV
jgi:hypothetical protein